jgi:lipopolysaccharide transport system ATP-binding protein
MRMSEILVTATGVSKKFCKSLKRSMLYGVEDIIKNVMSVDAHEATLRRDEFWAVDGAFFELRRGECLGLIGPNGSGKSTLLKMLNGILMPDRGSIEIKGRVGALIELGAGFHPMLTGRENIYINGAILGFSKKEIEQKFDSIVAFSELADFIDTPVKHYSSGMYVRLGFAVAAHMEPDVLLIDEVLAVGDAGFRAKCYDAIYSLLKKTAVIFVSHSMAHINRMCTSVLLLDKGASRIYPEPGAGISAYFDLADRSKNRDSIQYSSGQAAIENLQVRGAPGTPDISSGKAFEVSFDLWLSPEIRAASIYLSVLSRDLTPVASTKSATGLVVNTGESQRVRFVSPELTLAPEEYSLSISIFDDLQLNQILWNYNVCFFKVKGSDYFGTPVSLLGYWSGNTKTAA